MTYSVLKVPLNPNQPTNQVFEAQYNIVLKMLLNQAVFYSSCCSQQLDIIRLLYEADMFL